MRRPATACWVNRAVVRLRQGMDHEDRARALRPEGRPGRCQVRAPAAATCYDQAVPDLERASPCGRGIRRPYANLAEVHLRRGRREGSRCRSWTRPSPWPRPPTAVPDPGPAARKRGRYAEALPDLEEAMPRRRRTQRLRELARTSCSTGPHPVSAGEVYRPEAFDQALARSRR